MRNLDLLPTGSKPAPAELAIVQGFVNTLNVESGVDEIGTTGLLKAWLVRHGLQRSDVELTPKDLRTALSLREALRQLLLANNGESIQPAELGQINTLVSQLKLAIQFKTDGALTFAPDSDGLAGVFEQIMARIVEAVCDGTWFQLKACRETGCQWAFYDSSKNHSGRWCSMSVCGSRDKARAYRKRLSGKLPSSTSKR